MSDPCKCCKGRKSVTVKMANRSKGADGMPVYGTIVCPACNGKGYVDDSDRARIQSPELYDQIVG